MMSADTLSDPVSVFLCQPQNLPIALEVARQVEKLRYQFHQAFWSEFPRALEEKLEQSELNNYYKIAKKNGKYSDRYLSCVFRAKDIIDNNGKAFLSLSIEQGDSSNDYLLYYGLSWSAGNRPDIKSTSFTQFIKKVEGFAIDQKLNSTEGWPLIYSTNIALRSDDFMIQYAKQPEAFVEEISSKIFKFFVSIEPHLTKTNAQLLNVSLL